MVGAADDLRADRAPASREHQQIFSVLPYFSRMDPALVDSLRAAVESQPADLVLRLHLADVLLDGLLADEAIQHIAIILGSDPGNVPARALMRRAMTLPDEAQPLDTTTDKVDNTFDWSAAESELTQSSNDAAEWQGPLQAIRSAVRLEDVGGMDQVKAQLEAAFLTPMRNPDLRAKYGKDIGGGLLLYGPPGCGKTFIARAVAGELGARFISVGIADVLDMWLGSSERNLRDVFEFARACAPAVLFFDELDALAQRRGGRTNSAIRGTVNQFLAELDGVASNNRDVFVLAATNQPWEVDPAFRRPGRFDRTLLVLPPDEPARAEILEHHLTGRPIGDIDYAALARLTKGLSGADLAHVCTIAAEVALMSSARTGSLRDISQDDLQEAVRQVQPSIGPWLESARNVVLFANQDGTYDELRTYLKRSKLL